MRLLTGARSRAASVLLAVAALGGAVVPGARVAAAHESSRLPSGWRGYESPVYRDDASWLCRGGDKPGDLCTGADLTTTVVQADGAASVEEHRPAEDPPVDCFYVYPTASGDPIPNSDMVPGPEEIATTRGQAAPFTSTCRVFAPVYRQVPITAAFPPGLTPEQAQAALELAYSDVLDAFKHFIANDSHGRPFVLYGHSQGGLHLTRLIQEQIEDVPGLRRRLVSALIVGTTGLTVPQAGVVGGSFDRVPLCTADGQLGCLVAYSSYSVAGPPPADSVFGRTAEPGMKVPCVNPAALAGGDSALRSYWWMDNIFGPGGPYTDPARNAAVTTPRYATPRLVSAACTYQGGASYLAVTVHADPADPRIDTIGGDFPLLPGIGLHVLDTDLAMGDLTAVVASQAEVYTRCRRWGIFAGFLDARCWPLLALT